jgi:menaquinone-dependent protoporphyrinogen oxidase
MKVLVAVGSKYGATREVAAAIAEQLRGLGYEVDAFDAADVNTVRYYDAVIVGSAVYGGLWRRDASALVRDNQVLLRAREVWLFSVGMTSITQPDQPLDEAEQLATLVDAREHKRFDGRLLVEKLNVGEKALIKAINPPVGDFRDFDEIRAWADDIGVLLRKDAFA